MSMTQTRGVDVILLETHIEIPNHTGFIVLFKIYAIIIVSPLFMQD